jgi:hypothetical protein
MCNALTCYLDAMSRPYGPQPAEKAIAAAGLSIHKCAWQLGVPYERMWRAVTGRARPGPDVREALAGLLGVPVTDLFTATALQPPGTSIPGKLSKPPKTPAVKAVAEDARHGGPDGAPSAGASVPVTPMVDTDALRAAVARVSARTSR